MLYNKATSSGLAGSSVSTQLPDIDDDEKFPNEDDEEQKLPDDDDDEEKEDEDEEEEEEHFDLPDDKEEEEQQENEPPPDDEDDDGGEGKDGSDENEESADTILDPICTTARLAGVDAVRLCDNLLPIYHGCSQHSSTARMGWLYKLGQYAGPITTEAALDYVITSFSMLCRFYSSLVGPSQTAKDTRNSWSIPYAKYPNAGFLLTRMLHEFAVEASGLNPSTYNPLSSAEGYWRIDIATRDYLRSLDPTLPLWPDWRKKLGNSLPTAKGQGEYMAAHLLESAAAISRQIDFSSQSAAYPRAGVSKEKKTILSAGLQARSAALYAAGVPADAMHMNLLLTYECLQGSCSDFQSGSTSIIKNGASLVARAAHWVAQYGPKP